MSAAIQHDCPRLDERPVDISPAVMEPTRNVRGWLLFYDESLFMQITNKLSTTSSALHVVLHSKVSILLLLVPLTIVAEFFLAQHQTVVFFLSALTMIPLAYFLSESTEHLAVHTGPP